MRARIGWLLVGTMALGSVALAQERPQQRQQQARMHQLPEVAAQDLQTTLAHLHHINQSEIELGKLAQQKASTQAARQFGERMVREHQTADDQLMAFAKQQGIEVGKHEGVNDAQKKILSAQQATREMLQALEGPSFDEHYLASQLASHDHALHVARTARQRFPALAPLMDKYVPLLQSHRSEAYEALGQMQPRRQARTPPPPRR